MSSAELHRDTPIRRYRQRSRLAQLAHAVARLSERLAAAWGDGGTGPPNAPANPQFVPTGQHHPLGAVSPAAPLDIAGILTRWRRADRELRDPRGVAADRAYATLALDVAAPYLQGYETLPALLGHYLADRWRGAGSGEGRRAERPAEGTVDYWVVVACQAFPAGATRRQREAIEHAAFWRRFQRLLHDRTDHPPGLGVPSDAATPQVVAVVGARDAHDGGRR